MILSASKSLVLDLDYCISKQFLSPTSEHDIIKDIDSNKIIKVLNVTYNPYTIYYEKVSPICKFVNNIKKLVLDITLALLDIHKKGYFHGDVYSGNIGLNKEGNHVLYDFEFCKKAKEAYDYYSDIEMFLKDFIHYNYVYNLLSTLEKQCIIKEETTIFFLGKERKRVSIKCTYDIYDMYNIVTV